MTGIVAGNKIPVTLVHDSAVIGLFIRVTATGSDGVTITGSPVTGETVALGAFRDETSLTMPASVLWVDLIAEIFLDAAFTIRHPDYANGRPIAAFERIDRIDDITGIIDDLELIISGRLNVIKGKVAGAGQFKGTIQNPSFKGVLRTVDATGAFKTAGSSGKSDAFNITGKIKT